MFKRFVARLLIILQIYSNMFQGAVHAADLTDHYQFHDEIHLRSSIDKSGRLRMALGTNNKDKPEFLEVLDIESFDIVKNQAKKLAEIEENEVFDQEDLSDNDSTDDEDFVCKLGDGITRASWGVYFTLQGLDIAIGNNGVMEITGAQSSGKSIFLSGNCPVIFKDTVCDSLKITAPQIINHGNSSFTSLMLEGSASLGDEFSFLNNGTLTAKQLFLKNLNANNTATINSSQLGITGGLTSSGEIISDAVYLDENAQLKLTEDGNTDIKDLHLYAGSTFENHQNLNIDVLESYNSSISNFGDMTFKEVKENSVFATITNRHHLGFAKGEIVTDTLDNVGANKTTFTANNLRITKQGTNSGLLTTNSLVVTKEFTNKGFITTQNIAGAGELTNTGVIESKDHLKLAIKQLTNKKLVKAKSIISESGLQCIENQENANIIADELLTFNNKVINQGLLKAPSLTLNGSTTSQEGTIETSQLKIAGGGEFVNLGDIDVGQDLTMDLKSLVNRGNISAKLINGYKNLVKLKNDAGSMFKVRDGTLEFAPTTVITNDGTIAAQELKLTTDKTTNQGKLEAKNITLTGLNPFTNSGNVIASNKLSLNLTKLTNQKTIKASALDTAKLLELTNAKGAVIDTDSNLNFAKAQVTNDGTLKGGALEFKGGTLTQNGSIEGKSLKTTDKTVVTTTDGQIMSLSGELESDTNWSIRGQINAQRFTRYGNLDLYGTLNLTDSFKGYGTVHKGGKLTAKNLDFYSNVTIDGDVQAETLLVSKGFSANNLILNGSALIKEKVNVSGLLKVGSSGKLQGFNGSQLSLNLDSEAEIDGLVDVDNLTARSSIKLKGQLLSRKQTKIQNNLEINKYAKAELTDLIVDDLNITNHGSLQLNNQKKVAFTLNNHGKARINGSNSYTDQDNAIKILLKNSKTGHLTIKKGTFDVSVHNGYKGNSENEGTFIDDTSWIWFGDFKNTGLWTSPSSRLLFDYSGQDMGDYQVNGELHVNSLVDGIRALDGLHQTKTKKVILNAPEISNKPTSPITTKKYPWELELRIAGDINNSMHIHAPKLEIQSRNLKTTGDLFSTSETLKIDVENLLEINAKVGGNSSAKIKAKYLKLLGKANIPGASAPNVLYKRNGNGIYSNGQIILDFDDLIENTYGIIQGSTFKITAPKLVNLAGLIVGNKAKSAYYRHQTVKNTVDVNEIKNLRDDQGRQPMRGCRGFPVCGYTTARGGGRSDPGNWISPSNCYCAGRAVYYETSDEGVIFAQGDLSLTYNYLEMLASRISCGSELTFKALNKNLFFNDDSSTLPGTTKMETRNNHGCHIVARKDIKAEFGSGDVSSSFNGSNIFIKAASLTLQNLGIQPNQLAQLVSLGTNAPRLPFESKTVAPKRMVLLGKDAVDQDQANLQQKLIYQDNVSLLQQTLGTSFFTLYRGVNGLGLNPDELFKTMFDSVAEHVGKHKDTTSSKRSIKFGDEDKEIEILANPTLTPQNLLDSGVLGVFFEFAHNIHSLESEKKANKDIQNLKATLALPFEKTDGIHTKGEVDIRTTKGYLVVNNNVSGKNVKLISEQGSVTLASTTQRKHTWRDYHDTLISTTAKAEEKLLIQGKKDVIIKGANTQSVIETNIIAKSGMVLDKSVSTVDYKEVITGDHKSYTTTKTTHIKQHTSTHQSDGGVNIQAKTGVLQEGTKNINTKIEAPIIIQDDVHDQHFVKSHTITHKRGGLFGNIFGGSFFGIKEKKEIHQSSSQTTSKGCENSGEVFIAMAEQRFRAIDPSFTAKTSKVTAKEEIEIKVGTNTSQSQMQSTYQGPVWRKVSSKTESHITHRNPTFENNVYLYSPKVILEKVKGSLDTFNHIQNKAELIKDHKLQINDVEDKHESTQKSQKSLSTGASMLTKLAVGIAMMYATPVSGVMGFTGTTATMANAGFATLCSDTATRLIENDGNPQKTMQALSKSKVAMNVARSMLAAGLVGEISDVVGIKTTNLELIDYAKKAAISSAVNTVLAISIDNQSFEKAMIQGVTTAAISTAASYLANQIGGAYLDKQIDPVSHKLLHGLLGGVSGGITSKLLGRSFEDGAVSGALGAVVAETMTEILKPDLTKEMEEGKFEGLSQEEFQTQFMEKAQKSAKWADFTSALAAFTTGKDVEIAHQTGNTATENNFLPTIWLAATVAGTAYEGYQMYDTYQNEGAEAALNHLGITVATGLVIGGVASVGFKVGKKFYPTIKEAYAAALEGSPMLKATLASFENKLGKIEQAIQNKFEKSVKPTANHTDTIGLPTPKMVKHHIFNKFRGESVQSEKYRQFFQKHKINVDDFAVEITESAHKTKIHTAGKNWTTEWKKWIDANPDASTQNVYQKAGEMMDSYGISHVPLIPYK